MAAYYRAVDEGRVYDAADAFVAGATYAVPWTSEPEVQPRLMSVGRDAITEYLVGRGRRPYRHEVTTCLVAGRFVLLEGLGVDDTTDHPFATFVAAATLAPAGRVERYLAFSCARLWPEPPTPQQCAPTAALDAAIALLDARERADPVQGGLLLALDAVYSAPVDVFGSGRRDDLAGRDAVLASWAMDAPDPQPRYIVQRVLGDGHRAMVAGELADDDDRRGSFLSTVTVDGEGFVTRMVTFACVGAVPL